MKYKLGQLVTQYDEINQKGEFDSLDHLQGINSLKFFQECKSNKNDIDLNRYRICRKGMFAYNRATSRNGERISIAYRTGEDCLISPSYYCFSINDENTLLPEYLDIWFKRPVFDKYARFKSWGSATEFFTFEDFCETEIDLPPIEEQRKIVHDYKVITDRIELLKKINENLFNIISVIFDKLKKEHTVPLLKMTRDNVGVRTGKSPNATSDIKTNEFRFPVIGASGVMSFSNEYLLDGLYISTGRVGTIGKVMLWNKKNWFTDNSLIIDTPYIATLFSALKSYNFTEILGGSSNPKITQTDLNNVMLSVPSFEEIISYEEKMKQFIKSIFENEEEIERLTNLQQYFLITLGKEV